jgi:hypothetical protein
MYTGGDNFSGGRRGFPKWAIWVGAGAVIFVMALIVIGMMVSYKNREVGLFNQIKAKNKDNTSEFDNMWKKIAQSAEITTEAKNALKEIFVEHAEARSSGQPGGGSLATWIKESVPTVAPDSMPFKNLMNIITAARDRWTARQKELIDYKREYDNLVQKIPSCWFVTDRKPEITIITSSKTEKTFATGKDDDIGLFGKKDKKE